MAEGALGQVLAAIGALAGDSWSKQAWPAGPAAVHRGVGFRLAQPRPQALRFLQFDQLLPGWRETCGGHRPRLVRPVPASSNLQGHGDHAKTIPDFA